MRIFEMAIMSTVGYFVVYSSGGPVPEPQKMYNILKKSAIIAADGISETGAKIAKVFKQK